MERYGAWLRGRGCSHRTVQTRLVFARARWAQWRRWDLAPHELADWLNQYKGWTKCTYFAHLRSLYGFLVKIGAVDVDPTADMKRPPRPRPRPRPLTATEAAHALETATGDVEAYLLLGLFAGLRAHEIAKVRGEDITETSITVVGKGGQQATLPTHPLLWEVAQRYPRSGWWFPSPRDPVRPIVSQTVTTRVGMHFRQLGITGSSHRARHSYGTQLARRGAHLRVVQELMRHASLATTAAYIGGARRMQMRVFEVIQPGSRLDGIPNRDEARTTDQLLALLLDRLDEAAVALHLFDSWREEQTVRDAAPEASFEETVAENNRKSERVRELEAELPAEMSRGDRIAAASSLWAQANMEFLRQKWAAGQVPWNYDFRLAFMHARSFLYALDILQKTIEKLAEVPSVPEGVGHALEDFKKAFPGLVHVRDSAHHVEDRVRGKERWDRDIKLQPITTGAFGFQEGMLAPVTSSLEGSRYYETLADGSLGHIDVNEASMFAAQSIVQRVLDSYTWTGPPRQHPGW
jgi:integrase/recombinase XerD